MTENLLHSLWNSRASRGGTLTRAISRQIWFVYDPIHTRDTRKAPREPCNLWRIHTAQEKWPSRTPLWRWTRSLACDPDCLPMTRGFPNGELWSWGKQANIFLGHWGENWASCGEGGSTHLAKTTKTEPWVNLWDTTVVPLGWMDCVQVACCHGRMGHSYFCLGLKTYIAWFKTAKLQRKERQWDSSCEDVFPVLIPLWRLHCFHHPVGRDKTGQKFKLQLLTNWTFSGRQCITKAKNWLAAMWIADANVMHCTRRANPMQNDVFAFMS